MFVFFLTILHPEMCVYVCFSVLYLVIKIIHRPPPSSAAFLLIDF